MTQIESVLAALRNRGEVQKTNKGWKACCPAHGDKRPSLDIDPGEAGKALLTCRSKGCTYEAILTALGISVGNSAQVPSANTQSTNGKKKHIYATPEQAIAALDRDLAEKGYGPHSRVWDYPKNGGPHGKVIRWEPVGDLPKEIRPITRKGNGWAVEAMPAPRPLLSLSDLAAADLVIVTEGEPAHDAARSIGFVATTGSGGSNAAKQTDWRPLAGKTVWIWPDNDEPGRKYAAQVKAILEKLTPPAHVKILNVPGLPEKGDAVDWVEAHGDAAEPDGMRRDIEALAGADSVPKPLADLLPTKSFRSVQPNLNTADFVEDLLIDGSMSVVYGESGCGKTFLVLDLALHVAAGCSWFGRDVEQRGVLYLALEGAHGIENRIAAYKIANECNEADLPFAHVPVSLDLLNPVTDVERVIATAEAEAVKMAIPVGLVVVDTLSRAMAGGNENSPEDMTAFVRNIDRIRARLKAHTSVIHHSGKDAARGARGHSSLRAASDTEIEVARDGKDISTASITKQRDLECTGKISFRLHRVELGLNRRGKLVTSCVVREVDQPKTATATATAKLTDREKSALDQLRNLVQIHGTNGDLISPDTGKSVPESEWRENFYRHCMPGSSQSTKQKAFVRARDALVSAKLVIACDDRVWPVPEPGQPDTTRTRPDMSGTAPDPDRPDTTL